jgi:hypothetical protein
MVDVASNVKLCGFVAISVEIELGDRAHLSLDSVAENPEIVTDPMFGD